MKKSMAIILMFIALMFIALMGTASAELYPRFGNIIDIEYDTDFITVDDGLGTLWDFYSATIAMDHFYGDLVIMIIDDNNTPNWIYDDKIVDAYFCKEDEAREIIRLWKNTRMTVFPQVDG